LPTTKAKSNKIIKATLDLLRDHELEEISFLMISKKCRLDANDIKKYFLDIDSIIHAYFDDIDLRMIDSYSSNVIEETGKEIIFNIVMSRLDLLNENKTSLKRLVKGKSNLKI
jgi:AcrR family transcriptional regulator